MRLAVAGRFDADDGDVLTDWALAGHGITLKPVWEVAEHLKSARSSRSCRSARPSR